MSHRTILLLTLLLSTTLTLAQSQGSVMGIPPNSAGRNNRNLSPRGTLPATGVISGSVRTIDDRPIADAKIEVRAADSGSVLGSVYSNPAGGFEIDNLPAGEYEVVARSGLAETREHVDVQGLKSFVTLRLAPNSASDAAGTDSSTVSVAQMQVPEKARKAFDKGREAFAKGKLNTARSQVEAALQIDPDYADALMLRGLLSLNAGEYEAGRVDLEKAVQRDPHDGMAFVVLGSAYNALHRYDDALRVLDRGESLVPNSWQVYFERATALVARGQYEAGLSDLARASEFAPRDFPAMHLVKANALIGIKDYTDAQTELETFLQTGPEGSSAEEARQIIRQIQALTATARK